MIVVQQTCTSFDILCCKLIKHNVLIQFAYVINVTLTSAYMHSFISTLKTLKCTHARFETWFPQSQCTQSIKLHPHEKNKYELT